MVETKEDLISIIIPTYGSPDTLEKCVDSVLEQDYINIEVIVVDDNDPNTESRRLTEEKMSPLLNKDSRVQYLKHKVNKNGSAARNTGFRQSKGQYICYLDNDDLFLQGKLTSQIQFLKDNSQYEAVYCGYLVNGEKYHPKFKGDLRKELLLMEYDPVTSSLMFRRGVIEELNGFDEDFNRHQDYELMLRYFKSHQVAYVDGIYIDKGRTDDRNVLRGEKLTELKKFFFTKFDYVIDDLEESDPKIRKKIYSRHFSKVFLTDINHSYYKEGFKFFKLGMKHFPFQFLRDVTARVFDYVF